MPQGNRERYTVERLAMIHLLKIGSRCIDPKHVVKAEGLEDADKAVILSLSDGSSEVFRGDEAEMIRRYMFGDGRDIQRGGSVIDIAHA